MAVKHPERPLFTNKALRLDSALIHDERRNSKKGAETQPEGRRSAGQH
jgi:hypothetical protein